MCRRVIVRRKVKVGSVSEFQYLIECLVGPIIEPIENTMIEDLERPRYVKQIQLLVGS